MNDIATYCQPPVHAGVNVRITLSDLPQHLHARGQINEDVVALLSHLPRKSSKAAAMLALARLLRISPLAGANLVLLAFQCGLLIEVPSGRTEGRSYSR